MLLFEASWRPQIGKPLANAKLKHARRIMNTAKQLYESDTFFNLAKKNLKKVGLN
jgi:hypothetical protein